MISNTWLTLGRSARGWAGLAAREGVEVVVVGVETAVAPCAELPVPIAVVAPPPLVENELPPPEPPPVQPPPLDPPPVDPPPVDPPAECEPIGRAAAAVVVATGACGLSRRAASAAS